MLPRHRKRGDYEHTMNGSLDSLSYCNGGSSDILQLYNSSPAFSHIPRLIYLYSGTMPYL
jgi:hypothetical protein